MESLARFEKNVDCEMFESLQAFREMIVKNFIL